MPVGPGGANTSGTQSRQTFRPPWVKNDPPPVPMPTQPWVKSNRNFPATSENKQENQTPFGKVTLRKVGEPPTSKSIAPTPAPEVKLNKVQQFQPKENGAPVKPGPELRTKPTPEPSRVQEPTPKPVKTTEQARKTAEPPQKVPASEPAKKAVEAAQKPPVPIYRRTSEINIPIEKIKPPETQTKAPDPPKPPPPSMPPAPPAPPPPPMLPGQPIKSVMTPEKKQRLDMLRSRPKKRPDWGDMLKEIETGRKLNHVKCNDRSSPLLPKVKAKGQFVYESEKPNLHNQLLKQIEGGIRLKPTKTNDRSKPFIEGLRKFRRQMTIEEQIQKSASMASLGIVEPEPDPLDEVDDIDKVRDDLQSTKQLLAMELKNKEALERENKKLVTKILNLEVEIQKEKLKTNKEGSAGTPSSELQKEIETLKEEAKKAKELAEEMENKFHDVQGQYDLLKLDLDESVQKNQRLEKQLRVAQAANLANQQGQPLAKQPSKKIVHQNTIHETPVTAEESEEEEETETETETESEDDGANEEAQKERRLLRELKLLATKLQSFKNKKETAKKERKALKEQMGKLQKAIKEEKKNYKVLQKEVDKMSKLMNEDDEDEEEEEDEEEDEDDEETSEEEEETEESESEESEGDLPETAPPEKKKINLQGRAKKYENFLSSLKKGNYLLKANLDVYKDKLNKQKEMSLTLQEDLNSVLAELG